MAPHSSTLAWKIPWTEEPGRLQSKGSQRVRHDWATSLFSRLYIYWKNLNLNEMDFVGKVMSLLFNVLSRLVITFLPRSKHLLISWLQSPSAVILEPKKLKLATVSLSICHEVVGLDAMILVFWMLCFKPTFSLSSFTFIKRLFSSSSLSPISVVSPAYLRLLLFLLAIFQLMLQAAQHFLWKHYAN